VIVSDRYGIVATEGQAMSLFRSMGKVLFPGGRGGSLVLAASGVLVVTALLPMSGANGTPVSAAVTNTATPRLLATLANPHPKTESQFGATVAVSANTSVVSNGSGAPVDLYIKTGSKWPKKPSVVLTDPNPEIRALFGTSLAISGATLIVSAPAFATTVGATYIYVRTSSGWPTTPTATLTDPSSGDDFGRSVAISGSNAIVGADTTASSVGVAYIYTESALGWPSTPTDELVDPPENPNDYFGESVALSGTTALVGAFEANSNAGAAYIFTKGTSGWPMQAAINDPNVSADEFGNAVAISGTSAVVGADFAGSDVGMAYIFTKGHAGWPTAPSVTLANPAPLSSAYFGWSVALSGKTALIGVASVTMSAAYVYTKGTSGWPTSPNVTLADPTSSSENFSSSVALSGTTAVIGAPLANSLAGVAYIFKF